MLSFNKSNDKTVASIDNLNNSSADDDGTASAIGHSDPNPKNYHNSVETISRTSFLLTNKSKLNSVENPE